MRWSFFSQKAYSSLYLLLLILVCSYESHSAFIASSVKIAKGVFSCEPRASACCYDFTNAGSGSSPAFLFLIYSLSVIVNPSISNGFISKANPSNLPLASLGIVTSMLTDESGLWFSTLPIFCVRLGALTLSCAFKFFRFFC